MKSLLLTLAFTCVLFPLFSQFAPDFTVTDIDGESHSLYEYLDDGKTVILDFYAVWCGPCKDNAPAVEEIYKAYGPEGTNEIMILGIEGDDSSTDAETAQYAIDYNCSNPQVNDSKNLMDLFNVSYFPTYLVVCPDRSYKEYDGDTPIIVEDELTKGIFLCEKFEGKETDARLFSYNTETTLCNEYTTPNVSIMNMGSSPLTSVEIITTVNGTEDNSILWSGNLALYEVDVISLPEIDLTGISDPVVEVSLKNPNGVEDQNMVNDLVTVDLSYGGIVYGTKVIQLEIYFDNFPQETTWEIKNSIGEVIFSGGDYIGFPDFSPPIDTLLQFIEDDCYSFTIYDAVGDGICCAFADDGEGFWRISTEDGQLIAEGGVFTDQESVIFGLVLIDATNEVHNQSEIQIFPNPASETIFVQSNDHKFNWSLYSPEGNIVSQGSSYNEETSIDVSHVQTGGIYFLKVQTENLSISKKIVIVR